jgi:hypothetical protein
MAIPLVGAPAPAVVRFQWVLRVEGALTVASGVAEHLQTPASVRIEEVRIYVDTAPVGADLIVDVHVDGSSLFYTQGNRPTIADGANTATSGAVDGWNTISKDSSITVDVDQVGSGTAGADLTVMVRGRYW